MARLRFNRLLSQFLEGIISIFVARLGSRITFWQFCRDLRAETPSAALGRLVFAGHRFSLRLLRPRALGRLGVVGQNLGDSQHRDLVAIAALAARVLAATLLERDDLRPTLVLQHLGRHGSAGHGGRAERRRIAAEHQYFAKLHDRTDFAFDLAYLEHIIRDDAVLPAAGFDDCEHRLIPSCSIPASDQIRAGFLVSRYGYCATGNEPFSGTYHCSYKCYFAQKQAAREIPRRMVADL